MKITTKSEQITEGLRKSFQSMDCKEEKNISSPTGKPKWNRECIRKMPGNEKYAGAVLLQKTHVEDFFTGKQKKNTGQRQRYYYKDNHEAIVPLEVFERVKGT